jgi:hypothetical protein
MPRALFAGMDMASVATVDPRQRAAQSILVRWDQDQVHMIGHRHPRPNLHIRRRAVFGQQGAVEPIVIVAKEHPRPPIAPLGDVVREASNDNTGEAGHGVKAAGCCA